MSLTELSVEITAISQKYNLPSKPLNLLVLAFPNIVNLANRIPDIYENPEAYQLSIEINGNDVKTSIVKTVVENADTEVIENS